MNKKHLFHILVCGLFFVFSMFIATVPVYAAVVVDTGDPVGSSYVLDKNQWWAGQITTVEPYEVTEIKGFFAGAPTTSGDVTLVLYGDGGLVPDVNNGIFSGTFGGQSSAGWDGLTNLSWYLPTGTYWVAFEVKSTYLGSLLATVPNPLANYAWAISTHVYGPSSWDIGIKVLGNPIPIPSAVFLLGSGLIGIIGIRRKFKN